MEVTGLLLKRGILLFWALWLSIAWLSNLCDALKSCHILSAAWRFASDNYAIMVETTAQYRTPRWLTALLFAGVIIWQGVATLLLWSAVLTFQGIQKPGVSVLYDAFLVNLALWAALLLADEVFLAYETEATHLRIFTAQMVSLLLLVVLPEQPF